MICCSAGGVSDRSSVSRERMRFLLLYGRTSALMTRATPTPIEVSRRRYRESRRTLSVGVRQAERKTMHDREAVKDSFNALLKNSSRRMPRPAIQAGVSVGKSSTDT